MHGRHTSSSRPLTPEETAQARAVFGDAIRYEKIRIVTVADTSLIARYILRGMPAVVLGNRICFRMLADGSCLYKPDEHPSLFIHEMTHVYQYQCLHGWRYALLALKEHRSGEDPYKLTLDAARQFKDYGIEAQAMLVQRYATGAFYGADAVLAGRILREAGLCT